MKVLEMDMVGLDFLYDDEIGFRTLEVNSSPGFEGLEKACKVDVAAAIFRFLDVKLRLSNKHKARVMGWSKPSEYNPD